MPRGPSFRGPARDLLFGQNGVIQLLKWALLFEFFIHLLGEPAQHWDILVHKLIHVEIIAMIRNQISLIKLDHRITINHDQFSAIESSRA